MKYIEDTALKEQALSFALQVASLGRMYANPADVLRIAQQFYERRSKE